LKKKKKSASFLHLRGEGLLRQKSSFSFTRRSLGERGRRDAVSLMKLRKKGGFLSLLISRGGSFSTGGAPSTRREKRLSKRRKEERDGTILLTVS